MTPAINDTVWSAEDTTPAAIEAALRGLLIERHAESDLYVPARVLNLICIVDKQWSGEIANRLRVVGRNHASRTIVCAISAGRTTLDAVASVAATAAPEAGGLALTRETVIIDIGERHVPHLDSIVDPLVVTDLATVVWAPHEHWNAVTALHRIAQVVLLDSSSEPDVGGALRRATDLLSGMRVVDLAWLRSAPWRERIAATFDPPWRREQLEQLSGFEVRHHFASGAGALLLCGWLASRLGWQPRPLEVPGDGTASGWVRGVADCPGPRARPGLDPPAEHAAGGAGSCRRDALAARRELAVTRTRARRPARRAPSRRRLGGRLDAARGLARRGRDPRRGDPAEPDPRPGLRRGAAGDRRPPGLTGRGRRIPSPLRV